MLKPIDHGVMDAVSRTWEELSSRGVTMEEIGIKMGYDKKSARKSVHQFLKTMNPRIDMLYRFADATGKRIEDFVSDNERE